MSSGGKYLNLLASPNRIVATTAKIIFLFLYYDMES